MKKIGWGVFVLQLVMATANAASYYQTSKVAGDGKVDLVDYKGRKFSIQPDIPLKIQVNAMSLSSLNPFATTKYKVYFTQNGKSHAIQVPKSAFGGAQGYNGFSIKNGKCNIVAKQFTKLRGSVEVLKKSNCEYTGTFLGKVSRTVKQGDGQKSKEFSLKLKCAGKRTNKLVSESTYRKYHGDESLGADVNECSGVIYSGQKVDKLQDQYKIVVKCGGSRSINSGLDGASGSRNSGSAFSIGDTCGPNNSNHKARALQLLRGTGERVANGQFIR